MAITQSSVTKFVQKCCRNTELVFTEDHRYKQTFTVFNQTGAVSS